MTSWMTSELTRDETTGWLAQRPGFSARNLRGVSRGLTLVSSLTSTCAPWHVCKCMHTNVYTLNNKCNNNFKIREGEREGRENRRDREREWAGQEKERKRERESVSQEESLRPLPRTIHPYRHLGLFYFLLLFLVLLV